MFQGRQLGNRITLETVGVPNGGTIYLTVLALSDEQSTALESELQSLTVKELRQRATTEGVDEHAIERARDGHSPKEDVRSAAASPCPQILLTRHFALQMIKLIQAQADSNAQGAKAPERSAASEAQQKITNETDEDIEVSVGGQSTSWTSRVAWRFATANPVSQRRRGVGTARPGRSSSTDC